VGGDSEDDGYVLEVVYNGFDHISELLILDAKRLSDCRAKLTLRHHLPHQFHGLFVAETF